MSSIPIPDSAREAHKAGRLDEAEAQYKAVLATEPDHTEATGLLGLVYAQRKDYPNAEKWLNQAIVLDPRAADTRFLLARLLMEMGRLDEALAACDAALLLNSRHLPARIARANAFLETGQAQAALAEFDRVLLQAPHLATPYYRRGQALGALGRWQEALASIDRAVAISPEGPFILARALALHFLQRHEEAAKAYRQGLIFEPGNIFAQANLGHVLLGLGRSEEALAAYNMAYAMDPSLPLLAGNRRYVKMCLCDWTDYDADRARLLIAVTRGEPAVLTLIGVEAGAVLQQACARISAMQYIGTQKLLWNGERYGHARPRIAYISSDFRNHAVAIVGAAMFEAHDRTQFETFGISHGVNDGSPWRKRMEHAFEHFHDVRGRSEQQIAELLRRLEIDIAVDLNGYTMDGRPKIYGFRPAPIAVSFLGYPGTLGSAQMDYIIADRVVVPDEERENFDERVVLMPDMYMPNAPRAIADRVPTRTELGLPETGIVFCSFNHASKITPYMFALWLRLLKQIDGSVLWLTAGNPVAQANLLREAEEAGVGAKRLVFAPRLDELADHMARLTRADLFLDALPYNGHTTAADALWCGVPVVTCKGDSFPGRVAASLLHAMGLDDLITESLEAYEALALELARDPARLAEVKARLARQREASPVFDSVRFARHLETAYRHMLTRQQNGEAPESFACPPL